jgi:hypothetical protein
MDLSSLLNTQQKDDSVTITTLSLQTMQSLLKNPDSSVIINTIRSSTGFTYPSQLVTSFVFFDTFIQLLLCIDLEDDPYTSQSVMIDAFRNCLNGLLQQFGNEWLVNFSPHITTKTWFALRNQPTLLVYLYGIVLTTNNIIALVPFMQSNHVGILVHLWLTCCTNENEDVFLIRLEKGLNQEPKYTTNPTKEMIQVIKNKDASYVMKNVDLGGNKSSFSKDEFLVGKLCLESACRLQQYSTLTRLYLQSNKSSIGITLYL